MRKRRRRYLVAGIVAAVGLALQLVPWPRAWVDEFYLAGWFPAWSRGAATVTGTTPLSVSLLLLGVLLTALALAAAWALVAPRPRVPKGGAPVWRPSPWRPFLTVAAWAVAVLVFWFPLGFALAYKATSLGAAVAAGAGPSRPDSQAPDAWLLARLNEAAAALPAGALAAGSGLPSAATQAAASRCVRTTTLELREAYLPETEAAGLALPERVKALPAGTLLRMGYAGVISPWLLEPHVDAGLPSASALAVALHELAHTAGFAQEADAEAVGILAGLTCDDPSVRYAATLRLATAVRAGLGPEAGDAFAAAWPVRAQQDAQAAAEATARYRVELLTRGANTVYDAYLRAQGGKEGLREYDRGTQLALELLSRLRLLPGPAGGVGEGAT